MKSWNYNVDLLYIVITSFLLHSNEVFYKYLFATDIFIQLSLSFSLWHIFGNVHSFNWKNTTLSLNVSSYMVPETVYTYDVVFSLPFSTHWEV